MKENKDCDWCKGEGWACATLEPTKLKQVQKCDSCNVYESDLEVHRMLAS
jgi:hypothetical protein|tara:strand:+ start:2614 stop:2763 length:150 start_codon:yes stop_codon:yes gene_type:complete